MIHKACMPVYMNSGKIVADGRTGRVDGKIEGSTRGPRGPKNICCTFFSVVFNASNENRLVLRLPLVYSTLLSLSAVPSTPWAQQRGSRSSTASVFSP